MAESKVKHVIPEFPADAFHPLPVASLKVNPLNARTHSKKQIQQISRSIQTFGFAVPVLVDQNRMVIAGHGRLAAAKLLGLSHVPAIRIDHLSEVQKCAFVIADNRLAEKAGWDHALLAVELGELAALCISEEFSVTITGFETAEVDAIMADHADAHDPADDRPDIPLSAPIAKLVARVAQNWG